VNLILGSEDICPHVTVLHMSSTYFDDLTMNYLTGKHTESFVWLELITSVRCSIVPLAFAVLDALGEEAPLRGREIGYIITLCDWWVTGSRKDGPTRTRHFARPGGLTSFLIVMINGKGSKTPASTP
jgi:hypothetical protein